MPFAFYYYYYYNSLLLILETEVSKTEGRIGQTTNVVIGGTVTDDSTNEWLALDQKVRRSLISHQVFFFILLFHFAVILWPLSVVSHGICLILD